MTLFISLFGSGVTINSHFCGSKLKSVEINEAVHACCVKVAKVQEGDQNVEKASCCSFDSEFIFNSFEKIDPSVQNTVFAVAEWPDYSLSLKKGNTSPLPSYNKPPPISGADLLVRIQRFTC